MQKTRYAVVFGIPLLALLSVSFAAAWTGPTASPPSNNVAAPINVGSTDQVKNAGLGVNSLAIFGNSLLGGSTGSNAYLNFGATSGTNGYGIRDNAGTMEFKNSGDTSGTKNGWFTLQELLFPAGGQWAAIGNNIHNTNTGNVGIGTATPHRKLDLSNVGQLTFGDDVVTDSQKGIYWHSGSGYGIYRTSGAWTANTFQQLRMAFDTGIQLSPGTGVGTGYDKSYVEVTTGKGLMVTSGSVGIGTASPGSKVGIGNYPDTSNRMLYVQGSVPNHLHIAAFVNPQNYGLGLGARDGDTYGTISAGIFTNGVANAVAPLVLQSSGGNVGINTTNPTAQLDVNGTIKPGNVTTGAACTPEGAIGYDMSAHTPVYCNGSLVWAVVTAVASVPAGTMCGRRWVKVGTVPGIVWYESDPNVGGVISSNVKCQGNTITVGSNAPAESQITSVAGCPSGYSGVWTSLGTNLYWIISCVKN